MTLEEARRHSLAQLKLLARGHQRNEARRVMIDLEMMCAAVALAVQGPDQVRRLQEALRKQMTE